MTQNRVPVFIYHSLIELDCGQLLRISKVVVELHQSTEHAWCSLILWTKNTYFITDARAHGERGLGAKSRRARGGEGAGVKPNILIQGDLAKKRGHENDRRGA